MNRQVASREAPSCAATPASSPAASWLRTAGVRAKASVSFISARVGANASVASVRAFSSAVAACGEREQG